MGTFPPIRLQTGKSLKSGERWPPLFSSSHGGGGDTKNASNKLKITAAIMETSVIFRQCGWRANASLGRKSSLTLPSLRRSGHISNWLHIVIHTGFHHHYRCSSDSYWKSLRTDPTGGFILLSPQGQICIWILKRFLYWFCDYYYFLFCSCRCYLLPHASQYSEYQVTCRVPSWLLGSF